MKGILCAAGWFLLTFAALQAAERPPNVLMIIADDLNRRLPVYGDPVVRAPNVDRLASRSTRFDRAYCQYPVCSPSRVSLLSGRRPEQTRMFGNEGNSRTESLKDALFLPEYFRQNGYFTARVGKVFHIGRDVPECWDISEEGTPGNAIIYQPQEPAKLGLTNRIASEGRLDGDTGEGGAWFRMAVAEDQLIDRRTATRITELMQPAARGGKPFFIACGFRRPHLPWMTPTNFHELYPDEKLSLPEAAPNGIRVGPAGAPKASDKSRRASLRGYLASISFMDRQLGLVLDQLDRLKLWDNTVVLMFGDNGYHLGSRGGYWGKGTPYEDSCGVPLLIAAPGQTASRSCKRVVEYVDFYPTLVDLCGLPAAKDLAGRSLRPLLENPSATWDHPAFTINARSNQPVNLAVSTERFRYIEYPGTARPAELYDIQADPREWINLAGSPAHSETLANLRDLARAHREKFWK